MIIHFTINKTPMKEGEAKNQLWQKRNRQKKKPQRLAHCGFFLELGKFFLTFA